MGKEFNKESQAVTSCHIPDSTSRGIPVTLTGIHVCVLARLNFSCNDIQQADGSDCCKFWNKTMGIHTGWFWGLFCFNLSLLLSTVGCSSFIFSPAHELFQVSSSFPCHAEGSFVFPLTFLIVLGAEEMPGLESRDRCWSTSAFPLRARPDSFPREREVCSEMSHEFHSGANFTILLNPILLNPKHLTLASCICQPSFP